jgi:hypothetical protein
MGSWVPPLSLRESPSGCCLSLGGLGHGHGATLQEAAEQLVSRVLVTALALRSGGLACTSELAADRQALEFLYEVAELAARGGDVRGLVLSGERAWRIRQ